MQANAQSLGLVDKVIDLGALFENV